MPLDIGGDFARLSGTPCAVLYVTGIPEETTRVDGHVLQQHLYVIPAFGLAVENVSPALRHNLERRFGVIAGTGWTSSAQQIIAGMSGGPVFGVWPSADGMTFDYAVLGIQSVWDASVQQIAASPLDVLSRLSAEADAERGQ